MAVPERLGLRPFSSPHYQAHNKARLDHLASLGLPLQNRRVIELGSGPGDHTGFYLERGCSVTAVDARQVCLDTLRQRFPQVATVCADLNDLSIVETLGQFEIAHCYGILYHLERPECFLSALGKICTDLAIVETCVSPGDGMDVVSVDEPSEIYSQSVTNRGCRPSRRWVFKELARHFPCVYLTRTQPDHPEFPLDWTSDFSGGALIRSVFVASREQLKNSLLINEVPTRQERCRQVAPQVNVAEHPAR